MPINITTLPVGSYVKDPSTLFNGVPIKWRILDFNHSGYPTGTATLFAWNAKRNVSVVPDTTTRVDKTFRDIPITASSGGGKVGNHLDTFYENLGSKLKAKVVDTPLDIGYSGGYAAYSTSFKKENHKIFLFGAGEYNYGSSTYLSRPTTQKYFANMATSPTLLYQALGLVTTDQPILSRDIKVSTSDYYCLYPGYIYGTSGDYPTGQYAVNIFPMMNISTADLTVLDDKDTDGSYILNLTENKFLIQDGLDIKGYGSSTNRKSLLFGEGCGEFKGLASNMVNKSFSISFWIKTSDAANNVVLETNLQNSGYHFQVSSSETSVGNIHFGSAIDTTKRVYSKTVVTDGNWHHICGVVNISSKTMSIYVDGVFQNKITNTSITTITGMTDIIVASRKNLNSIKGNFSQLCLWNKELSDEEVMLSSKSMPNELDQSLIALYPMEEGTGTALIDITKKQANGLLSGAYTWVDEPTPSGLKTFIKIGDAPATKSMFDVYGLKDFTLIKSQDWSGLTAPMPEILCWTDDTTPIPSRYVHTTGVPKGVLLQMNQSLSIKDLQAMRIDATVAGTNVLRFVFSGDQGKTWYGTNGVVALDATQVSTNGYTLAQLGAMTAANWTTLFPKGDVRVSIYLERQNVTDAIEVRGWFATEIKYAVTPALSQLSSSFERLVGYQPSFSVSRDDGVTWQEAKVDELNRLDKLAVGKQLRVKVALTDSVELHAISYSWG